MRYLPHFLATLLAAGGSVLAQAQTSHMQAIAYDAPDSEVKQLHQESMERQYVHVLVDLNVDNSLAALKKNSNPDFSRMQDAVLQSIDGDYVKGAIWRSRLGQISAYVTEQGFTKLLKNALVRNVLRATERNTTYDAPAGELRRIEEEIRNTGSAVVSVIPSSRAPRSRDAQKPPAEPLDTEARKREFIQSLHMENFEGHRVEGTRSIVPTSLDHSEPASRSIDFIVKLEGFYELKSRDDVRSIRLVSKDTGRLASEMEPQKVFLDPAALAEAEKTGSAIVGIDLKRWLGYTPISALLTPAEQQAQRTHIRQMLTEIVEALEPGASAQLQIPDLIPSAYIHLKLDALRKLYQAPDPRIERVNANRGIPVALNVSTTNGPGGTSAQQVWPHSRGSGQWIAVIDSGVQTNHPMFNYKQTRHACFGTNNATHYSTCRSQGADGDSPPSLANSGTPCGYVYYPTPDFAATHICGHGTHVAGIAAGRGGSYPPLGVLNGVAIDADIMAINSMSRSRTDASKGIAYDTDLIRSLEYVQQVRLLDIDSNITVNMSLSGLSNSSMAYAANCDTQNKIISDLIGKLKNLNVAVVVSTGNDSNRGGIGYPACLSGAVKVGATDKYTGQVTSFTNMQTPWLYTGAFFLAPGTQIYSSLPTNLYGASNGTSMAAPHIAGAMALVRAVVPTATVDEVNAALAATYSVSTPVPLSPSNIVYIPRLKFL